MKKVVLSVLFFFSLLPAFAQFYPGSGSNEDLWQTERDFNSQDNFLYDQDEGDFRNFFETEENDVYINEYEIKLLQERERKRIEAQQKREAEYQKIVAEREQKKNEFKAFVYEEFLFQNLLYGVGSGAIIGVSLARAYAQDLRENLQFIGTSIVLGAIIGVAFGTKEIYYYDVPPDVALRRLPEKDNLEFGVDPLVGQKAVIGYRINF